ncbi:HutP family protein [Tepidibacillus marianensis]|uniref:HutP family protein n=1 Tax=Tepidibacillus marianensis TaxID=3131995 RepID=UPI0030CCE3CB
MREDEFEIVKDYFWPGTDSKIGTASVLLALSSNIKGEESIKALLNHEGLKCVVTEVGGKSYGEFQDKITKAVIGACLNNGIIEKTSTSIHAVLHAAEEAKREF